MKEREREWVVLDEVGEVNVDVREWEVGALLGKQMGNEGGEEKIVSFKPTRTVNVFTATTTSSQIYLVQYHPPPNHSHSQSQKNSKPSLSPPTAARSGSWIFRKIWPVPLVSKGAEAGVGDVGSGSGSGSGFGVGNGKEEDKDRTEKEEGIVGVDVNLRFGVCAAGLKGYVPELHERRVSKC